MLIVEGDPDCRSAGSFFKNPLVSDQQRIDLEHRARKKGLTIPSYPALEQRHKVSAAWLVEHAGFARGYALDHAGISSKHSLAIINRGGATAAEIVALKDQIQNRVEEVWGIRLQPEPVFVGIA
jgi:UDP-N-acetylmuramate dehydrogenase